MRGSAVWGLMVLCAPACVVSGDPDGEAARTHLERWQERGPNSYVYVVAQACNCAAPFGPVRVVVEGERVSSAVSMPTGLVVESGAQTMTELLEHIVQAAEQDNDEFSATYDETLGYLKSAKIEHSAQGEDNEYLVRVTCLASGTDDWLCPLPTIHPGDCSGEQASARPEPGVLSCIDGLPIGRIAGSEKVCCPGLAARECSELEPLLESEVEVLQGCDQDSDCTWDTLLPGCRVAHRVDASLDLPLAIANSAVRQGCPLASYASFCGPAAFPQELLCEARRCTLK